MTAINPPATTRLLSGARRLRVWLGAILLTLAGLLLAQAAHAQGVDLPVIKVSRSENGLTLDFSAHPALSKGVEDAMQRGVPLYFVAEATVFRSRWYWRDERIARAQRVWRISYQPLTGNWRVSLGAIGQTMATAQEALATASRATRWKIAELSDVEPGEKYYVEFSYRLDSSQLPRPMQLDLGAQAEWRLSAERTLKVE